MKLLLYENIAIWLCTGGSFLYGYHYLRDKKTLYASMIVLGMACFMLVRLFQCAWLWTGGSLTDHFQVGMLGIMGGFSFFFSANYGQFDSLVDDGSGAYAKYRRISSIAPICVMALYVLILTSDVSVGFKIGSGLACAMMAAAGYYHLKHVLIPDAAYGIVRCLRKYNAMALCLAIMSALELVALSCKIQWLIALSGAGLCLFSLTLVPTVDWGLKVWRT